MPYRSTESPAPRKKRGRLVESKRFTSDDQQKSLQVNLTHKKLATGQGGTSTHKKGLEGQALRILLTLYPIKKYYQPITGIKSSPVFACLSQIRWKRRRGSLFASNFSNSRPKRLTVREYF